MDWFIEILAATLLMMAALILVIGLGAW